MLTTHTQSKKKERKGRGIEKEEVAPDIMWAIFAKMRCCKGQTLPSWDLLILRGDFPMKFCGLCYAGSTTLWVLMVTESFKDISACLQVFHWAGNYNLHPGRWIISIGFKFAWAKIKTWAPDSCLRLEPVWVCGDVSNNIFVWFSPWAQPESYWFGKISQSKQPSLCFISADMTHRNRRLHTWRTMGTKRDLWADLPSICSEHRDYVS